MRKAFIKCIRSVKEEFCLIHERKDYISVKKQVRENLLSDSQYIHILCAVVNFYIEAQSS